MKCVNRLTTLLVLLFAPATYAAGAASEIEHVLSLIARYHKFQSVAVSHHGNWLAYTTRSLGLERTRLLLRQNSTGTTTIVTENASGEAPCFSPDERYIAFLIKDDNGLQRLAIQELSTGQKHEISGVTSVEYTHDGTYATWSADSTQIAFIGLRDTPSFARTEVKEPMVRGSWSKMAELKASFANDQRFEDAEFARLYPNRLHQLPQSLYIHDPARRATSRLVLPGDDARMSLALFGFRSSPAKLLIGRSDLTTERPEVRQDYQSLYQITLSRESFARVETANDSLDWSTAIPTLPVKLEFIAKTMVFLGSPSWSPGGQEVGSISQGALAENDVTVYALRSLKATVVTGNIKPDPRMSVIPTSARNYAHLNKSLTFGATGGEFQCRWTTDGSAVFFLHNGNELWLGDAHGRGSRIVWSAEPGALIKSILGEVSSSSAAVVDEGVLLETTGSSAEGDWTELINVNLEKGTKRMVFRHDSYFPTGQWAYADAAHKAFFITGASEKSGEYLGLPGGLVEVDVKNGAQSWVEGDRSQPKLGIGRTQFLQWKGPLSAPGAPNEGGTLLIPASANKAPCVLIVYPRGVTGRKYKEAVAPGGIAAALLAAGYAVFWVQTEYVRNGKTREQIVEGTARAVHELEKLGSVDQRRLGVLGLSFGGYAVNCILTEKSAFKAAVSISGMSNLISDYHSPTSGSGQAEVGEPLYQHVDEYIVNSPVLFADRVEVPLLLMHGGRDENIPVMESSYMFNALRQLGKPAELAIYPEAHHDLPRTEPIRDDMIRRIVMFFDYHLKGTS